MAIAAIGTMPLPLQQRSVIVHMVRHDGERKLRRFDRDDVGALVAIQDMLCAWSRIAKLDPDPVMPAGMRNRVADNWRPLIAIADSFGGEWPKLARAAAVEFERRQLTEDEDAGVILLQDIHTIFGADLDRISSGHLVQSLIGLEDGRWSEWRGPFGDRPPRRMTQGMLSVMLRQFQILPRTIRLGPGRWRDIAKGSTARGYFRAQFTRAWRAYGIVDSKRRHIPARSRAYVKREATQCATQPGPIALAVSFRRYRR